MGFVPMRRTSGATTPNLFLTHHGVRIFASMPVLPSGMQDEGVELHLRSEIRLGIYPLDKEVSHIASSVSDTDLIGKLLGLASIQPTKVDPEELRRDDPRFTQLDPTYIHHVLVHIYGYHLSKRIVYLISIRNLVSRTELRLTGPNLRMVARFTVDIVPLKSIR